MNDKIKSLSNKAAIKALYTVTEKWFETRGLQAHLVITETTRTASVKNEKLPSWVEHPETDESEAGNVSKRALYALSEDDDIEIRTWATDAISEAHKTTAHFIDPITAGIILGGLILAARVKKVGPDGISFYEGIPKGLGDILKAGASFFSHF